jgi:ankyrin repeat protein
MADNNEMPPLFAAINRGDEGAVITLLDADPGGASTCQKWGRFADAFAFAFSLIGNGEINKRIAVAVGQRTALGDPWSDEMIKAINARDDGLVFVRLLIDAGLNVNRLVTLHDAPNYPLTHAVNMGNLAAAELLLAGGADANAGDSAKTSPLHRAAAAGSVPMLHALIGRGADTRRRLLVPKGEVNVTSLHYAAVEGQNNAVYYLLTLPPHRRPDVNDGIFAANGGRNSTPLFSATMAEEFETAALLLDHRADDTITSRMRNSEGYTSLMALALFETHLGLAERLIASRPDGQRAAYVNMQNKTGKTALHYAAEKGKVALIKLLLASGADKSITDNGRKTARNVAHASVFHLLA